MPASIFQNKKVEVRTVNVVKPLKLTELIIESINSNPFDLENLPVLQKLTLNFRDIKTERNFEILRTPTNAEVRELTIIAFNMIQVLWAVSRVRVKNKITIDCNFEINEQPMHNLLFHVLKRVNPELKFKLKLEV